MSQAAEELRRSSREREAQHGASVEQAASAADAADAAAAAAALLGALTAAMSAFYERCVARAAHGAPASRLWGALARTVLKGQLWGYFEGETDFGRQLEAFEPASYPE